MGNTDDQQLQTTLTDKELQLAAVKQHTEQQSEQQSSSAAAQRSSQLEQQLLTCQVSLKQLQEQLDASTQSAASAVSSLQSKPSNHTSHLA